MVCQKTIANALLLGLCPCADISFQSPVQNANHIFNAVHSSMRQWGSALNHNGMSFFLAHISAGAKLYHGTGHREGGPVTYGYLAFEQEHAQAFARPVPRGPEDESTSARVKLQPSDGPEGNKEKVLLRDGADALADKSLPRELAGWLRTYTIKRDLRVLYIDGLSAAKVDNGPQDSQTFVLNTSKEALGNEPIVNGFGVLRAGGGDHARVYKLCEMVQQRWHGYIDGFIRNEFGYELILCDFNRDAELVDVVRLGRKAGLGFAPIASDIYHLLKGLQSAAKAISDTVTVDHDSMVTAFATDIDLFAGGKWMHPRLNMSTRNDCQKLLKAIDSAIVDGSDTNEDLTNWQSIADQIVTRYSDDLYQLGHAELSAYDFDVKITLLTLPFVDNDGKTAAMDMDRCIGRYIPKQPGEDSSVPRRALTQVMQAICRTLLDALSSPHPDGLQSSKDSFKYLTDWLRWTTWKDCRPGCAIGEICFAPTWPWGDIASHETPRCMNATGFTKRVMHGHYWRQS